MKNTVKVIYLESAKYRIEPVYDGNKPVAFKVIEKETGESTQFPYLWEAEQFIGKPRLSTPSYR